MNKMISKDSKNMGNYYDAACLYSRMGELEKSIKFLQTALEKSCRCFAHLEMDDDLTPISELPEFKEMKKRFELEIEAKYKILPYGEEKTIEIPSTKEDGVYKVKCTINSLPLYFVFDTGASDVSLSSVETASMMKNGCLKPTDVLGKQNYMVVNGEIGAGTIINLRDVNFEGLDFDDVG